MFITKKTLQEKLRKKDERITKDLTELIKDKTTMKNPSKNVRHFNRRDTEVIEVVKDLYREVHGDFSSFGSEGLRVLIDNRISAQNKEIAELRRDLQKVKSILAEVTDHVYKEEG